MEKEGRKVLKDSVGRCEGPHCVQNSRAIHSILNVEVFDRLFPNQKLALKGKLRKIKMEKGDSIPKYLTKFVHCKDELGSVGVKIGRASCRERVSSPV